jgi:hypothetical protein
MKNIIVLFLIAFSTSLTAQRLDEGGNLVFDADLTKIEAGITYDTVQKFIDGLAVLNEQESRLWVELESVIDKQRRLKESIKARNGEAQKRAYFDRNFANSIRNLSAHTTNGKTDNVRIKTVDGTHRVVKDSIKRVIKSVAVMGWKVTERDSARITIRDSVHQVIGSRPDTTFVPIEIDRGVARIEGSNSFIHNGKTYIRTTTNSGKAVWPRKDNWKEWFK